MSIVVTCKCGKNLKVDSRFGGRKVKCPACSDAILVPDPNTTPRPGMIHGGRNAPGPVRHDATVSAKNAATGVDDDYILSVLGTADPDPHIAATGNTPSQSPEPTDFNEHFPIEDVSSGYRLVPIDNTPTPKSDRNIAVSSRETNDTESTGSRDTSTKRDFSYTLGLLLWSPIAAFLMWVSVRVGLQPALSVPGYVVVVILALSGSLYADIFGLPTWLRTREGRLGLRQYICLILFRGIAIGFILVTGVVAVAVMCAPLFSDVPPEARAGLLARIGFSSIIGVPGVSLGLWIWRHAPDYLPPE